jgi:hypothetical protein
LKRGTGWPFESIWLYVLAGVLLIGGPVWHYLYVHRYPFNLPEATILVTGAALLGALVAIAGWWMGGVWSGLIFGGLILLFVDLQFNLEPWVPTLVIIAVPFAFSLVVRKRRGLITCISLGVFNLASVPRFGGDPVRTAQRDVTPGREPPLLVHLVLDEQWGIGGLRAAAAAQTADFLRGFYLDHGFEVYEGAYSRSDLTIVSISEMLSLGARPEIQDFGNSRWPNKFRLLKNPYFKRLREMGYDIEVYQTDYFDYCHAVDAPVASCVTVANNSIANIAELQASLTLRTVLAARYFLNATSAVYGRLVTDNPVWRLSLIGRALTELERARSGIITGPGRGVAMFIHVLAPHRPLEVHSDCEEYKDPAQRIGFDSPPGLSFPTILSRYDEQVRCLHREIEKLLAAIDGVAGRDGAIVIVSGDHGARMPGGKGDTVAAPRSGLVLNSDYPTLLAIRRPHFPGGLHPGAVPVQDFLKVLIERDFAGPIDSTWQHYVYFMLEEGAHKARRDTVALRPEDMVWERPIH